MTRPVSDMNEHFLTIYFNIVGYFKEGISMNPPPLKTIYLIPFMNKGERSSIIFNQCQKILINVKRYLVQIEKKKNLKYFLLENLFTRPPWGKYNVYYKSITAANMQI